MVLGDAAREEMLTWAAHGRMGMQGVQPLLHLDVPARADRGGTAVISWRAVFARGAQLSISAPTGDITNEVVPLLGRRRVALPSSGRYTVALTATPLRPQRPGLRNLRPRSMTRHIDVIAPAPAIRLSGPGSVTLGDATHVTWAVTEANTVRLLADGQLRAAEAAGVLELELDPCGQHAVTVIANGEGGRAERTLTINVLAPPVAIEVEPHAAAPLGEYASVRYAVTGARARWIDFLDQREPDVPIPAVGRIEALAGLEPEIFRLVAEGHDGRRTHRTVTISASLFDDGLFGEEIDFLNEAAR